jgi:mRNA interferase RelE/StbE
MEVELSAKAKKYLLGLNEPIKGRIKNALLKLEQDPLQGDIKNMSGEDGYRLRIGNYRILFKIKDNQIRIHEIGLRGQIYKGR